MPVREFRCTAHNIEFESEEEKPRCPSGCSSAFVVLEFRTPFSIRSNGTSTTDNNMKVLAEDYGLTNMRNDRDASVMHSTSVGSGGVKREYRPEQLPTWKPLMNVSPGWALRGEPAPQYTHQGAGLKGTEMPKKPMIEYNRPYARKALSNVERGGGTVFVKPK